MISNTAMISINVVLYAALAFFVWAAAYAFGETWIDLTRLRRFNRFAAFLFLGTTICAGLIAWYLKFGPNFLIIFALALVLSGWLARRNFV